MTSTTAAAERRQQLADVFVGLLDTDVTMCDRDALASLNEQALQIRGWLDAFDIKVESGAVSAGHVDAIAPCSGGSTSTPACTRR